MRMARICPADDVVEKITKIDHGEIKHLANEAAASSCGRKLLQENQFKMFLLRFY